LRSSHSSWSPPAYSARNPPTTRILVVDDEESVCKIISRCLAPLGFDVDTALDADRALDSMRAQRADVALVDIRMPGRDGVWLIDRLQEQYPRTAIVIVTGVRELDPRLTLRPGVISLSHQTVHSRDGSRGRHKAVASVASLPKDGPLTEVHRVSDSDLPDFPDTK
jgi:CheY-like chemotaxis protein